MCSDPAANLKARAPRPHSMRVVGGRLSTSEGLVEGHVRLDDDGRVAEVGQAPPDDEPDAPGVVAPAPANAHTHLGDRLARERFEIEGLSVQEAVAPPDGLKHRILRRTSHDQLVKSMNQALREAHRAGARRVIDFREGGPEGARALQEAAEDLPLEVTVLGRPSRVETWDEDADPLVDLVDGIGISGLEDQPEEVSRAQADWAREHGKRLALHVSEARSEDVELALSLDPDLLVHATYCTGDELERIAGGGVPVAACPRSNALFGNRPPLEEMIEAGLEVGLGTDNAMFHEPDPLEEAAFVADEWPGLDAETILAMACHFALDGEDEPAVEPGQRVVVVDDTDGLRAGLRERRFQTPGNDRR